MNNKLVFVDAESDGLYGELLTVALIATDMDGEVIEKAYYGICRENMKVTDPWVIENVLPKLGDYEACETEDELLEKVWAFWLRYQEEAHAICDVGYPVEMRLFQACVQRVSGADPMKAPYPLLDISSLLIANGLDPLLERKELITESESELKHNALADAEVSVLVWKKLMKNIILKDYLMAKSIHVFAWPFMFDRNIDNFSKEIETKGWKRKVMDYQDVNLQQKQRLENFMRSQYMSKSAKNIFMNAESSVCKVYTYPEDMKEYCYVIQTNDKRYELAIDDIELHVYQYGSGILFFRTLNMDHRTSIDDIKLINDLGRRVSLPFIPNDKNDPILCAEYIGIVPKEECRDDIEEKSKDKITNFRKLIKEFYEKKDTISVENMHQYARFIDATLNCNLNHDKKNTLDVHPTTDDRMFVISMIRDNYLSKQIGNEDCRKKKSFEDKIYSIVYVDPREATCQHDGMRQEQLNDALYPRWMDYGSLYGVTGYSFIGITTSNPNINYNVVQPFYVEYLYMVSAVLAQKLSIMKFASKAEGIARNMKNSRFWRLWKGNKLTNELQEEYITFKNSLLVLEMTCQEQGVELYRLLQKQLRVDAEKDVFDEELHGLYEVVSTNISNNIGVLSLIFAIVAIVIALYTSN